MSLLPWSRQREVIKKAEECLVQCCELLKLGTKQFNADAKKWLSRRKWEDDFSDMKRAVFYAALSANGAEVGNGHFPLSSFADHEAYCNEQFTSLTLDKAARQKIEHFFERLGLEDVTNVYDAVIEQVERPLIDICLSRAGGNQLKAARMLGINRNTLRKKMKSLKI